MARISDKLAAGRTLSFEFFPPTTPAAMLTLGHTVAELAPLRPDFASITYGAGGIGASIGALLQLRGASVLFIARGEQGRRLQARQGASGQRTTRSCGQRRCPEGCTRRSDRRFH